MAILIALILTTTLALVTSKEQLAPIEARIEIVPDIATFKTTNPGIELIPLEITKNTHQQLVYTVGTRVDGDRLVASDSENLSWSTVHGVIMNVRYPQSSSGTPAAVVSYVEVVVDQSSDEGRAYVIEGGVGQRNIAFVVEAHSTTYFNFKAEVYGY